MAPMGEAVRRLTACRLCQGAALETFADFGEVPLGNNLQQDAAAARAAAAYPLKVVRCGACGHFQLGHAVAPELLYATNYTYLSGISDSFARHLDAYAGWVEERCALEAGALVVDVGSNDGTCLKGFQARGYRVCGVDPASLAAGIANDSGIETINAFFDDEAVAEIVRRHGQATFVTSHNVLAHVDDLGAVFRRVHDLLADGGWFGFEIGYFREVLRTGCFDTIYHEHLDYHHAAPLARHLTALGFDLVDLSVNPVQGGSLRLLLRKTGKGEVEAQPQAFLADERESVLYDEGFLAGWMEAIDAKMAVFREAVAPSAGGGRRAMGYGAPTKATLLLKAAGLGAEDIAFVVEDNPHKAGRYLPGTGIAILQTSELFSAEAGPVVIFAWNFADEIVGKLRGKLAAGSEAVIPLPNVRTISL